MYTTAYKMVENISREIHDYFGDDYKTYGDNIEQGLEEPCFLITIISNMINHYVGDYYIVNMAVEIQYIETGAEREKLSQVETGLFECLENVRDIELGALFCSKNRQSSVTAGENVLNFSLEFEYFLRKQEAKEYMKEYKNYINAKEADIDE